MSQDEADFEAAVDECISSGEDASPGSTSDCDSFVSVDSQLERSMFHPDAYEEFKLINIKDGPERKRRLVLPAPKTDVKMSSLMGQLKNFVGKDLTRVTIPVDFNEPLTFLQRLTEDLEYSELLDLAADPSTSPRMRLMYLAVFSAIPYASVSRRYSKPFNPLLAETFELIREDKGYACIGEQVSHHPPITCVHAEHEAWSFWQEYKMESKFRPTYFKVDPTGSVHFKVRHSKEHFSWKKPVTVIHNIIIGTLWNDQDGTIVVTNHLTGERAEVEFRPHSKTRAYRKVRGWVYDKEGNKVIELSGDWMSHYLYRELNTESWKEVWRLPTQQVENKKLFYGFSDFAMALNDHEDEDVAPTDCRKRPDQRHLEFAELKEAGREKDRLEEKQRAKRKTNNNARPQWFHSATDPDTGETYHMYQGGYWPAKLSGNWSKCPDIFGYTDTS